MSKSKTSKAGKAGKPGKGATAAPAAANLTNTAAAQAPATVAENNSAAPENSACIDAGTVATLAAQSDTQAAPGNNAPASTTQETTMDRKLTLNTGTRKGNVAVYQIEGSPASVRINKRLFAGDPPAELTLTGDGMAEAKGPKRKLTKEERAALPKPTPQEQADRAAASAKRAVERATKLAQKAAAVAPKA